MTTVSTNLSEAVVHIVEAAKERELDFTRQLLKASNQSSRQLGKTKRSIKYILLILISTLIFCPVASAQELSIFTTQTPAGSFSDGINYELGLRFRATVAGRIVALRFYKSPNETGTHTGRLWDGSGRQLASVVFSGETASGWQRQNLTAPISILANTEYMVTVNTGGTRYSATNLGLSNQIIKGNLTTIVGSNGRYGPVGAYPVNSWENSNYFRDVVFVPGNVQDTTPPSAPSNLTATAVSSSRIDLKWGASTDNVGVSGYRVFRGTTQAASPTGLTYSDTGLLPATSYSYTVRAVDAAGNVSNPSNTVTAKTQPPVGTQYTITVSASPSAGGTVSGGGTFAAGSSRTVTATANSGYSFVNWTGAWSARPRATLSRSTATSPWSPILGRRRLVGSLTFHVAATSHLH